MECSVWSAQGSGKTIPPEIEIKLSALWLSRVELKEFSSPDEIAEEAIFEGAVSKITVNSYERNPEARRKCLNKWGYSCVVCNFHFQLYYGEIGKGYIHVHHLKPISTIGSEYEIDPVKDLRPVCPNCHAMLHRQNPPLSIDELKQAVLVYGGRSK